MASLKTATSGELSAWLARYNDVHIDLGTGNGAYALHMARANPGMAVIGLDTCLDNLTKAARRGLPNLRLVAGDATSPPAWLHGAASSISVNFPFGSLLRALVEDDEGSYRHLLGVARPGARVEIRVNGSAAKELGISLDVVRERLRRRAAGAVSIRLEPHAAFRTFPSEWAKRLAYGRPSDVVVATARLGA